MFASDTDGLKKDCSVAKVYIQRRKPLYLDSHVCHDMQDLKADTDIDLENIVYYKDDTHYFVMTAKKDSLYRKGVLKEVRRICDGNYRN